jgi:hypothetical protein
MPGCVIRVSGPFDRLSQTISTVALEYEESGASRWARERGEAGVKDRCTFNLTVSNADGDCVPVQISDAETFLSSQESALRILRSSDGIDDICIDFGWNIPEVSCGQWNSFPYTFLEMCASLRIDLVVSVYPFLDDSNE